MQAKILGRSRVVRACVLAATTVLAAGVRAGAQAPDQRIWDGVFTGEQAQRGKPQFETNCGACHGAPGAGGSDTRCGPTLIGDRFMRAWEFSGLNQFVSKVFDQMPQGYPSNVEDSVKLDIIAICSSRTVSRPARRNSAQISMSCGRFRSSGRAARRIRGSRPIFRWFRSLDASGKIPTSSGS